MKKQLISIAIMFLHIAIYGQSLWWGDYCIGYYIFDFENTSCHNQLEIDTINNPEYIWQIAKPQKNIFNSSHSPSNVIITDSVNTYPVNSNSYFIIKHLALDGYINKHTATLEGYYYVDSDSLLDYGKIEFSGDNGISWIDILNDSIIEKYVNWELSDIPVLTGTSYEWKYFWVYLVDLTEIFDIKYGDTLQFKFTFISDGIDTGKDGLMFDDLQFIDYSEGIENQTKTSLKIYPNPSYSSIFINTQEFLGRVCVINIYRSDGNSVDQFEKLISTDMEIDISNYSPGYYLLEILDSKNNKISTGRFVKGK